MSLIHQKVLVIAEVAWEPRVPRGVYLVTWEVDGGGLKGNLFTDSTCVTLSLWPDTIYHIQVGQRTTPLRSETICLYSKIPSHCFRSVPGVFMIEIRSQVLLLHKPVLH